MTDLEHAYNYAYILRCGDGSLYTGWTNDIKNRLKMHREAFIKKLSREEKERLLEDEEWKDRLSDIGLLYTDLCAETASSQEDFV